MNQNENLKTPKKQSTAKIKPRFIVSREYGGQQTMQAAFEQMIEKKVCDQYEQWLGFRG